VRGLALDATGAVVVGRQFGNIMRVTASFASGPHVGALDEDVLSIATSGDGAALLVGGRRAALALVRGDVVEPLRGHTTEVSSVAVSHDGRWAASGDHGGALWLWDLSAPVKAVPVEVGSGRPIGALDFSTDGDWLFAGDWSGDLRVIRIAGGAVVQTMPLGRDDDGTSAIVALDACAGACCVVAGNESGLVARLVPQGPG
jgi:WD40 repeat protein